MKSTEDRVRALLAEARADEATPGAKARVHAAVASRLAASAPAVTLTLAKAAALAVLTGALGFGAGFALGRSPERAAPPSTATSTLAAPPANTLFVPAGNTIFAPPTNSLAGTSTTHTPEGTRSATAHAPSTATNSPPVPGDGSLAAELALLREVHRALREGDAARAQRWIDEHAARHPNGALREERDAARVLALCAAGLPTKARAEADRFLLANPRSIQADRVRGSCAFASNAPPTPASSQPP